MHWGRHPPPQADIPSLADTPWAETPLGRHPHAQCMLGDAHPPAQYMLGYTPPAQYMLGYTPHCPVHAGIHPPTSSHCCGWYASYWNAFLFSVFFAMNVFSTKSQSMTVQDIWLSNMLIYPFQFLILEMNADIIKLLIVRCFDQLIKKYMPSEAE